MRLLAALPVLAALLAAATAAQAQTTIQGGQTLSGQLDTNDYVDPTEPSFYNDIYMFDATAGEAVEVRMNSDAFDAFVGVGSVEEVNGIEVEDDDSGGNLNALVRFTAPLSGEYFIIATSVGEFETGAYQISLSRGGAGAPPPSASVPLPPAPAQTARQTPIAPGQTLSGEITGADPQYQGKFYDAYVFKGAAGQSITLTMTSAPLDTYLMLFRADNLNTALASDDDGAGSLNALVTYTLPANSNYVVYATTAYQSSTGPYQISFTGGQAPRPQVGIPPVAGAGAGGAIAYGQSVSGALEASDTTLAGKYLDLYRFTGQAGERVVIDMTGGFDSYLQLVPASAPDGVIAMDDDTGEGLNAQLTYVLPASGEYVIRATSASAQTTGAYGLTLTRGTGGGTVDAAAIQFGQNVNGNFAAGRFSDYYRFTANAGDNLRIVLTSPTFDTDLYLYYGTAAGISHAARNDDGGGNGTNSLLEYRVPASGEYVIRATSFGSDDAGAYSLSLSRQ